MLKDLYCSNLFLGFFRFSLDLISFQFFLFLFLFFFFFDGKSTDPLLAKKLEGNLQELSD